MLRDILPVKDTASAAIMLNYANFVGNVSTANRSKLVKVLSALEPIRHKIDMLNLSASSGTGGLARPVLSKLGSTTINNSNNYGISNGAYQLINPVGGWTYSSNGFANTYTSKELFFAMLDVPVGSTFFQGCRDTNLMHGWYPVHETGKTIVGVGASQFETDQPDLSQHRVVTLNVTKNRFDCYASKTSYFNGTPPTIPNTKPYRLNVKQGTTLTYRGFAIGQALTEPEINILVDALSLW